MPNSENTNLLRLGFEQTPNVLIIGDVHGCLAKLRNLVSLAQKKTGKSSELAVISVGDLIDRGPHSSGVIDWFLAKEPQIAKYAVMGNHEQMFLSFLKKPRKSHPWLKFGGIETLQSYGLDPDKMLSGLFPNLKAITRAIPEQHKSWLEALPHIIQVGGHVITHAGFNPDFLPSDQDGEHLVWGPIPDEVSQQKMAASGIKHVHGHIIVSSPDYGTASTNIDTGAFQGGKLSGLFIRTDNQSCILQAD